MLGWEVLFPRRQEAGKRLSKHENSRRPRRHARRERHDAEDGQSVDNEHIHVEGKGGSWGGGVQGQLLAGVLASQAL